MLTFIAMTHAALTFPSGPKLPSQSVAQKTHLSKWHLVFFFSFNVSVICSFKDFIFICKPFKIPLTCVLSHLTFI
jgi:hypothetical protein